MRNRDTSVTLTCEICGKEFHPHRNHKYGYRPTSRFCSIACRKAGQKQTASKIVAVKRAEREVIMNAYRALVDGGVKKMEAFERIGLLYGKHPQTIQKIMYGVGAYKNR